jgi:hypothetical protein
MSAVFIAIGNSDDKLSQHQWVAFQLDMRLAISECAAIIHGEWHSFPDSIYQNCCWCIDIDEADEAELKKHLYSLAEHHSQNSIAWNLCQDTEFIGPGEHT